MVVFATLLFCGISVFAQNSENIVILWDVTGSLLPDKSGVIDPYNKQTLRTLPGGNGLWVDLKKAVIDCIDYAEENPNNEITVITFNDNIRDIFSMPATEDGKNALIKTVKAYKYKGHSHTNIVDPVRKFYSLLDESKINYMFLFTDGKNDQPATAAQFLPTINSWAEKTKGQNAYGFYVLVHPDADNEGIKNDPEHNFWKVPDAKVRIKICSFPSSIKYNIRDEEGAKMVGIRGKYAGAKGRVTLIADDPYYDIISSGADISSGEIAIDVKQKAGTNPPAKHSVTLTPQLSGADPYTFVGPKDIILEVSNFPERSLLLTVSDVKKFSKASFVSSFLKSEAKTIPAESDIKIEFNEQAKIENSSAEVKVCLMKNRKGAPASNFTICMDGKELKNGSFEVTPDTSNVHLSVEGGILTKESKYYGRIELIPKNLDNCAIKPNKGDSTVYSWDFRFEKKWNPFLLGTVILLAFLIATFLLWMIVLKPIFYPRFGSIQKTFIIPGMAPLVVKFKGARMVVVAASHSKKQSGWNRFWTGKIIYKTHPAFEDPITFKPIRGRRVLARAPLGTYQILPNPIPGVGEATIFDVRKNLRINIH